VNALTLQVANRPFCDLFVIFRVVSCRVRLVLQCYEFFDPSYLSEPLELVYESQAFEEVMHQSQVYVITNMQNGGDIWHGKPLLLLLNSRYSNSLG
jgi:hypothetical protein